MSIKNVDSLFICSKRASKDASDRQRLIDRLIKKIKKNHPLSLIFMEQKNISS